MGEFTLLRSGIIRRASDGAYLPPDPGNPDYAAFLGWQAAGGVPDAEPAPPPPNTVPAGAFLDRFTDAEKTAVFAVCTAVPSLGVGLTMGLARGEIRLDSPVLAQWMAGLVAAGALNDVRRQIIMAP